MLCKVNSNFAFFLISIIIPRALVPCLFWASLFFSLLFPHYDSYLGHCTCRVGRRNLIVMHFSSLSRPSGNGFHNGQYRQRSRIIICVWGPSDPSRDSLQADPHLLWGRSSGHRLRQPRLRLRQGTLQELGHLQVYRHTHHHDRRLHHYLYNQSFHHLL